MANTHLFWDPEFVDVKLWQSYTLIKELESFLQPRGLPLVLCGDFNSLPDSAVYELFSTGCVHPQHKHLEYDTQGILPDAQSLSHSIPLCSAFAAMMGKEPEFTNYTEGFKGVIDYVWFSADTISSVGVLNMPSAADIEGIPGGKPCPNTQHPSDHLPIVFDFVLNSSLSQHASYDGGAGKATRRG